MKSPLNSIPTSLFRAYLVSSQRHHMWWEYSFMGTVYCMRSVTLGDNRISTVCSSKRYALGSDKGYYDPYIYGTLKGLPMPLKSRKDKPPMITRPIKQTMS